MDIDIQELQDEVLEELHGHMGEDPDDKLLEAIINISALVAACAVKRYHDKLNDVTKVPEEE